MGAIIEWVFTVIGGALIVLPLLGLLPLILKWKSMSRMQIWARINVALLWIGFSPMFGAAMINQIGPSVGLNVESLLDKVIDICLPVLALALVSSVVRLTFPGLKALFYRH